MTMHFLDISILLASLLLVLVFAVYPRLKVSIEDYWVNSRRTNTLFLSASLISSIIGAGTLFAVTSMGYAGGAAGAILGVANGFGIILFGLLAAPVINRLGRERGWMSLGDPVTERYDTGVTKLVGYVNLIAFFFFAAAQFSALARVLSVILGWEYWLALIVSSIVIVGYTYVAGLRADIRSDFIQMFLIAFAAIIILWGLLTQPGISLEALMALPAGYYSGFAYAGPEFLIGVLVLLPLSVFVTLDIWQRALAANSPRTARNAFVSGGIIMSLFFIAFSLIGTLTYLIAPRIQPDTAIIHAIGIALPVGLVGLILAGLVAALMSTADSMIIAASISVANDISSKKLIGKPHIISVAIGGLAAVVAFAFPNIVQLLINAFSSLLILAPIFIGVLGWKRATSIAAKSAIVAGLLTTIGFMFVDATIAFIPATVVSALVFVIVSLLTSKPKVRTANA